MAESAKKILAVMSDLFFSVKVNDAAKKFGMMAEFVKDPALALEKAKAGPPMIVLDLNCAEADPLGLIAALKADPGTAGTPIVGFVSHVQIELRQRAVELGCDTVVARSVFAETLVGQLGKLRPIDNRPGH
jgi:CheY-like chemotaxis protein